MLSFLKKKREQAPAKEIRAFISGKVIPIEEVADPVFSGKMLGDGLAIEPTSELITAPCDGVVTTVMSDSKHAVGMTAANGMELLIHEGIDTVSLNGEGFKLYVNEGDKVKAGDKLLRFDAALISSKGLQTTCILAVTNSDDYPNMKKHIGIDAAANETVVLEAE